MQRYLGPASLFSISSSDLRMAAVSILLKD